MKRFILALILLSASPAFAQEQNYTPLQQYLYNESGYAPPALNRAAPAPQPVTPYTTAYTAPADIYAAPTYEQTEDIEPVGGHLQGMNY